MPNCLKFFWLKKKFDVFPLHIQIKNQKISFWPKDFLSSFLSVRQSLEYADNLLGRISLVRQTVIVPPFWWLTLTFPSLKLGWFYCGSSSFTRGLPIVDIITFGNPWVNSLERNRPSLDDWLPQGSIIRMSLTSPRSILKFNSWLKWNWLFKQSYCKLYDWDKICQYWRWWSWAHNIISMSRKINFLYSYDPRIRKKRSNYIIIEKNLFEILA